MTYRDEDFPKQRLLDYLTRSDELMVMQIQALGRIEQVMAGIGPQLNAAFNIQTQIDLKNQLANGTFLPYSVKTQAMDTAQTDFELVVEGKGLVAATDGSLDNCFVRFNNRQADQSPLKFFDWDIPFYKLYLTWPAQATRTLYLAIGRMAGAKGQQRVVPGQGSSQPAQIIYSAQPAFPGPAYSTFADWRSAKRVVMHVTSTLDQIVNLQPIGNIADATASAVDIGPNLSLAVGNVTTQYLTVTPAFDDWHPYIGMRITPAAAPAAGTVTIQVVEQD